MSIRRRPARGLSKHVARLFLLASVCAGAPAHAHEYCVGDAATLNNALAIAAGQSGETTVIKIRQGTYDVRGTLLDEPSTDVKFQSMQLLGGYADADCTTRNVAAANTVLDAHGHYFFGEMFGSLWVDGLQWQNFAADLGLYFNFVPNGHDFTARFSNDAFIGSPFATRLFDDTGLHGEIDVVNDLFAGVSSLPAGDALVTLEDDGADNGYDAPGSNVAMRVTSSTIVGSPGVGLYLFTTGDTVLADDLVWGSTGFDVKIEGDGHAAGSAVFFDDSYPSGSLFGSEATGSLGTSHADPLFVGSNDFHLQTASPAINSGTTGVAISGVDLDGHPRVVGSTVDRGAYESSVDDTAPQVLTVTNTNANGAGSLYQAIVDANTNPDFNYVEFDIPGSCPAIIHLASALPALAYGAKIDGTTQPGSAPNTAIVGDNATRCIILDGGGSVATGIGFSGASTTHLWVQGLAFEGFSGAALSLGGGNGDVVLGNQFGGKVGSTSLSANGTDIKLAQSARNALIGYDVPAFRNVIGGATNYGISIGAVGSSATAHTIAGNLFGISGSGAFIGAASNTVALHVTTGSNTIAKNLFGNNGEAIELVGANAANNVIENNGVGKIPPNCIVLNHVQNCFGGSQPNGGGVDVSGGAHDNTIESNTIWYGTSGGIQIDGSGQGNKLWGNSIDANGGSAIALGGTTEGDNDAAGGAANLPNRGLNAPVALSAYGGTRAGMLDGTLDSINGAYSIQIHASAPPASGYDRYGWYFLGSGAATIAHAPVGANGHASFHLPFSSPGQTLAGLQITLLATDSLGNTSQFSAAVPYQCDVIFRSGFDDDQSDGCPKP